MDSAAASGQPDVAARAATVHTRADLARLLRDLRRREARERGGRELTYQQVADLAGWSVAVTGEYLTGAKLPSTDRFDELVRLLGARPHEQGPLATARERVADEVRMAGAERAADPFMPPQMLPIVAGGFTGRTEQFDWLDGMLATRGAAGPVVISAVGGMGGVGKTALAVRWARATATRLPDGQLYVNLRGYDPGEPLSTMDALSALLSGLGVTPAEMPHDVAGRASLYHELLAGRRALVLLDNASGVEQVRPLLPRPPSIAVVTSRDDLTELTTVDGARRLKLDVLPHDEAVALLRLLIGERADREPDAIRDLARRCGRLPLALRVAAEHVVFRAAAALRDLVDELDADPSSSLDALDAGGDARSGVRAVFSWSLRRLPAPAARAFRLLGLVPGGSVDTYDLASLAGVAVPLAEDLARALTRAHLIQPDGNGRFSMHDLLRAYARESAERDLSTEERRAAVTRLFDHYLAAAIVAVDTQLPYARPIRPLSRPEPTWTVTVPGLSTVPVATQWLSAQRDNLVRACVHAARHGWSAHAVALASALLPVVDAGHFHDGLIIYGEALHAVDLVAPGRDSFDRAYIHFCLSVTHWYLGKVAKAEEHAQRVLAEMTRLGEPEGVNLGLIMLSMARTAQGRLPEAAELQRRGIEIARSAGLTVQEATHLHNLGVTYIKLEDYQAAADVYHEELALTEASGDGIGSAEARNGIATSYAGLGRYDEALTYANEALLVELEHGRLIKAADLMEVIGGIYRGQGRLAQAEERLTTALALAKDAGDARLTALVLNTLGETCNDGGDHKRAAGCHREARELATRAGDRLEEARALAGLGDAHTGLGHPNEAVRTWRLALAAYEEMNLPAAARVRARLDGPQ